MTRKITTLLLLTLFAVSSAMAQDKSRGLWACKTVNEQNIFVSWRMRKTDDPLKTTYKLYADGNLVKTLTNCTNTTLSTSYATATFSLEVLNAAGQVIDRQDGTTCKDKFYHNIKLEYPGDYTMPDGTVVTYSPFDCSAYDMDGDGEQEIIMEWKPSNTGPDCKATAPQLLDCYKLDGTRLWRLDFGPNVLAGIRFTFLCYDFNGDGRGEVVCKTAQGSKDATGHYLSTGPAATADHTKSSINSSGVITDGGQEWITIYDGVTGKELSTIDYWPLFNIQSNWDDRPGGKDDNTYGHRGNWFKGCVAFLDVNGKATPCAVTVRGIYTYSYAAAYTWDGSQLKCLWKHTSDQKGKGIYAEGAHSLTAGDMDGDGFDEIMVGTAAIDHDGTLLWRTGLGHGDATHLGDFDPDNEGLEVFSITESTDVTQVPYSSVMLDAKTGNILASTANAGSDTGRGMPIDCDGNYDGAEFFDHAHTDIMTCKGVSLGAPWKSGSINSSSINYSIFWDGDLLREYHDRSHVDKWNNSKTWDRIMTFYNYSYGASGINKECPCLQADILGDWREEAIYWGKNGNDYYLTIFTTTTTSPYKLPWLRDDHTYDLAVAWQNCGYNQPPHLGYSPVEYYKELDKLSEQEDEAFVSGYELKKELDFSSMSDTYIVTSSEQKGTAWETGNQRQQKIYNTETPAELKDVLAFQSTYDGTSGSKGWRIANGGLFSQNADRSAAVLNLKKGDKVVFECSSTVDGTLTLTNGSGNPDGNFTFKESENHKNYYCTMTADGQIGFCGKRYYTGIIKSIKIYSAKETEQPVTVTADDLTMTYGEDVPELTFKTEGAELNGTPSLSTTATKTSGVGTYPIVVEAGTVTNTLVTFVNGTLTINKAPLTVGVENVTITEGDDIPGFKLTYNGFRNNDNENNAFTTLPIVTTTATSASAPGNYPITVSDGEAKNYAIEYTAGVLTIEKKPEQPVTVTADDLTMTYGEDVPELTFKTEGAELNGTPSLSTTATKTSGVGTYPIVVEAGTVTNTLVTFVNGTLTINKAPLTVGVENVTITEGDDIPDFTLTYNGFRNNDNENNAFTTLPIVTTTATSASAPGNYPITVSGGEAKNYAIEYTQGELTIEENPVDNAIMQIVTSTSGGTLYDLNGRSIKGKPGRKGIYIMKFPDGKIRMVHIR